MDKPVPWYGVVKPTDAAEQGDFLFSFPIINIQDLSEIELKEASFQIL
nr:hypothetical protein [Candidatus Sigynarchaeota archaeon]